MKAKELMIGDWIEEVIVGRHQWSLYDFKTFEEDNKEEYLKPIPLTAEILEKNGFVSDHNSLCTYCTSEIHIQVVYRPFFTKAHIVISKTDQTTDMQCFREHLYVHEFQRALRLSELYELADNFKV